VAAATPLRERADTCHASSLGFHSRRASGLSMFCSAAADVVAIDRATSKATTMRPDEKLWEYILRPFAVRVGYESVAG